MFRFRVNWLKQNLGGTFMNKSINIQDNFLNQLRKESIPVTVYLTNGFQIRGVIKAFDNFTIIIDSEGRQQMVYKHAISTFTPLRSVSFIQDATVE
jgi:host factor-I protein